MPKRVSRKLHGFEFKLADLNKAIKADPNNPLLLVARAAVQGRGVRLTSYQTDELIDGDDAVARAAYNILMDHLGEDPAF